MSRDFVKHNIMTRFEKESYKDYVLEVREIKKRGLKKINPQAIRPYRYWPSFPFPAPQNCLIGA